MASVIWKYHCGLGCY